MNTIDNITSRIRALGRSAKMFSGIDLNREQQTFERDKPKEYVQLTNCLLQLGGRRIVEIDVNAAADSHSNGCCRSALFNDARTSYVWRDCEAEVFSADNLATRIDKAASRAFKNAKFVR